MPITYIIVIINYIIYIYYIYHLLFFMYTYKLQLRPVGDSLGCKSFIKNLSMSYFGYSKTPSDF